MKAVLAALAIVISLNANATHWAAYYVYFETEYVQGPWSRMSILDGSDYKYLEPQIYEGSFGSVREELVNAMISHLQKKKPDFYQWNYDLTIQGDTVTLTSDDSIDHLETIKNEITATLVLNNFKAVVFKLKNGDQTLTIDDLTLPYFDLVTGSVTGNTIEEPKKKIAKVISCKGPTTIQSKKTFPIWLILSGVLNLGLILLLFIRRKK